MKSAPSMAQYLRAVDEYGLSSFAVLCSRGFVAKAIVSKADKAARKGYTEYGSNVIFCWLTSKGRSFIGHIESD